MGSKLTAVRQVRGASEAEGTRGLSASHLSVSKSSRGSLAGEFHACVHEDPSCLIATILRLS